MKTVLIAAVAALFAAAGGAYAGTSHIVGRDGPTVPLDVMCHRAVTPAPGETLDFSVDVIGEQVYCLIRRPDPFARCVRKATLHVTEKADHGPGKPGDEIGAKAAVAKIQQCAKAHL